MNQYGSLGSGVSGNSIYGSPQRGGVAASGKVNAENPVADTRFQPAVIGSAGVLSLILGMILFLVVMRVLYEMAGRVVS